MKRLIIATKNTGKVVEMRSALQGLAGWCIEPLPRGTPDVEETGTTFLENALLKARHYSNYVDDLTLADDSGLAVDALGGRPGVHSSRYAETVDARIRRLLKELEAVPEEARGATFYCALGLARKENVIWSVQRKVIGRIGYQPSGSHGFGYDPVFRLPELNRTMAELTTGEKNRLSARGKALAELRQFLNSISS